MEEGGFPYNSNEFKTQQEQRSCEGGSKSTVPRRNDDKMGGPGGIRGGGDDEQNSQQAPGGEKADKSFSRERYNIAEARPGET